jgi:hypothetical protein
MTTKEMLEMVATLVKTRMNDLETMDQNQRLLHERISHQASLIGLLVEVARGGFSGSEEAWDKITECLKTDRQVAAQISRQADRLQASRDQTEAALATFQAAIKQGPAE